ACVSMPAQGFLSDPTQTSFMPEATAAGGWDGSLTSSRGTGTAPACRARARRGRAAARTARVSPPCAQLLARQPQVHLAFVPVDALHLQRRDTHFAAGPPFAREKRAARPVFLYVLRYVTHTRRSSMPRTRASPSALSGNCSTSTKQSAPSSSAALRKAASVASPRGVQNGAARTQASGTSAACIRAILIASMARQPSKWEPTD